ncbi:LADA_0F12354g1_1 [Lachancea dasiensis]|uniref:LADA_0F12354g1_1 n=1 Tax=Lachancea dasiensis TaxID=1072105 RepID=A0A1G4JME8_9SACH|nr:LADA_0F12354g1_1 [Lachancea dasiensis]
MVAFHLLLLGVLAARLVYSDQFKAGQFPWLEIHKDKTGLYYVNASIGTPAQTQMLRVDISQPYMWVFSPQLKASRDSAGQNSSVFTIFDADESSTSQSLSGDDDFNIQYNDRISFNGSTYMDTVEFKVSSSQTANSHNLLGNFSKHALSWRSNSSTLTLPDSAFFYADSAALLVQLGALGLGSKIYSPDSQSNSSNFNESFYFLDRLTSNGFLNSPSYSMWLGGDTVDSLDSLVAEDDVGVLILGGVDRSLYTGDFMKFDTLPFYDPATQQTSNGYPIVPLSKVNVKSKSGQSLNLTNDFFAEPVLLDSRYRYNYLPLDLIVRIALQADAYYVPSLDRWLLACDVGRIGASITFEFGKLVIDVPLSDLMGSTYDASTNDTLHFSDSRAACELKFLPNTNIGGLNILGGPFIKNTYFAAELASNQVAMAQAVRVSASSSTSTIEISLDTATETHIGNVQTSKSANLKAIENSSAIRSGTIPFATSENGTLTESLVLSPSTAAVSNSDADVFNQFTASVSANGVINTGRSFYNTSYSTLPTTTGTKSGKQSNIGIKPSPLGSSLPQKFQAFVLLLPLALTVALSTSV